MKYTEKVWQNYLKNYDKRRERKRGIKDSQMDEEFLYYENLYKLNERKLWKKNLKI